MDADARVHTRCDEWVMLFLSFKDREYDSTIQRRFSIPGSARSKQCITVVFGERRPLEMERSKMERSKMEMEDGDGAMDG